MIGQLQPDLGQRQRLVREALPAVDTAGDAERLERGSALQHRRPCGRPGRNGVEMAQRRVDRVGGDPAARPRTAGGTAEQDVAVAIEPRLEVAALRIEEVGRLDDLRQLKRLAPQAQQLLVGNVRRQVPLVARIGQAAVGGRVVGHRGSGGVGKAAQALSTPSTSDLNSRW